MAPITTFEYVSPFGSWDIKADSITSPFDPKRDHDLILWVPDTIDGTITAKVTAIKGGKSPKGNDCKVAALVARCTDPSTFYSGGIGADDRKYYIDKRISGNRKILENCGDVSDLGDHDVHELSLEVRGSQLILRDYGHVVLMATDSGLSKAGSWGARTWRTQARFECPSISVEQPTCFVIMPFKEELDGVWATIKHAVESFPMQCIRADEHKISRPIVTEIKNDIASADLLIIDLTGRNPNVFYEAGFAEALNRPYILITQDILSDLAFDIQHIRVLQYSNAIGGEKDLELKLTEAIKQTTGLKPLLNA